MSSQARKLADLLDISGDVKTDHLDNATYSDVTTSAKGLMTSSDKGKLDGIEAGAKADQTKADIDTLGINASTVNSKTVATNVPSGAVFTDTNTTYSVGDGGLTQKNFTTTLNTKLSGIETGATADQTKADIEALGVNASTLDAYNNTATITGNAVDIFIYDTSKDSDGGAWRKRTQDTSWYNEAASTTRGSRKDFPAVAVIVAEATKVTIYDGDTPDLDMWMVFDSVGYGHMLGESGNSSVCMMNARIALGCNGYDLYIADLLTDGGWSHSTHAGITGLFYGNIQQRNTDGGSSDADSWVFGNSVVQNIIDRKVNDVAMTVLPNAPIDSATGLPTPTIAVATDGGVSVIKDDGTVVDITASAGSAYNHAGFITFSPDSKLVFEMDSGDRDCYYIGIPSADRTVQTHSGLHTDKVISYDSTSGVNGLGRFKNAVAGKNENTYFAHTEGVSNLIPNISTPKEGSVAYITSKYNTGYMTGDIRGAWNVDTDVTTLGTELVTNGAMASDTGWSKGTGWTISGGQASCDGSQTSDSRLSQSVAITAGKFYRIKFDWTFSSGDIDIRLGGSVKWSVVSSGTYPSGTTVDFVIQAGSTNTELWLNGNQHFAGTIDNVSVTEAIPDRSVKGNGLAVHGTPTVSAVATGAELKCISGFSSSNYLEQPYNSDLDFGTGDFSMSCWAKNGASAQTIMIREHTSADSDGSILLFQYSGKYYFYVKPDGGTAGSWVYAGSTVSFGSSWAHLVMVRSSGKIYGYVNGNLECSFVFTGNVTNNDAVVRIGRRSSGGHNQEFTGSIALPRISATAPTAEQIKEIYEAEKPLFQENAKCTLNGTSDAVTAMSYDDSNEELLVGTSGGLSVFKGLRRVDENTNNITEVAQQGGLRVEEY